LSDAAVGCALVVIFFHLFDGKKVEPKSHHDQSPAGRLPHRLYAQARRPAGPRWSWTSPHVLPAPFARAGME